MRIRTEIVKEVVDSSCADLTRVFVAIYESGSLTAAGRRLFVTQSAISQSLARLRRELGDPLFERTAQGMRPTALAEAIYPELHEGLSVIDRTLAAVTGFDPSTSERTFRIALSELGEIGWLPAIGEAMAAAAPRARLAVSALRGEDLEELLTRGSVDLAITPMELPGAFERQTVKREGYRVVMSAQNPLAETEMTLEVYRGARRVWVEGDSSASVLAGVHARQGVSDPPALSVQHVASLPPLLARSTTLIATIPETLAVGWSRSWPLVIRDLPFALGPVELHLYRRRSPQHTGALDWFFATVSAAVSGFPGGFEGIHIAS
ncbi:LysR family transcriptional regulator [Microbacterium schleiferi]|uniref:LysR family transcriptional regulator n=1 Tax=Microbacterium schleiferi TaxID=69362 RepID=UPI001D16FBFD|nr:LysR family transcriptional regulator [Microbacterium schleiferi]MCC4268630.1 LysR family transcriptional regulator [Microbacterium schleiferi]